MLRGAHSKNQHFWRLVQGLKDQGKTCTVVESCCGGLINASIMAVPGSSAVYYGGSVAYNTKKAKKLLLNDDALHQSLTSNKSETEAEAYIRSKEHWTSQTALAFCEQLNVDYAIAEGGASGPTFRPKGLDTGFAVVAIAGRDPATGKPKLLAQSTIRSTHADRQLNMTLFANAAADLAADTMGIPSPTHSTADQRDAAPPKEGRCLNRATHLRTKEALLKDLENRADAKCVVLKNSTECLFSTDTELALVSKVPSTFDKVFLGMETNSDSNDGAESSSSPLFTIDVDDTTQHQLSLPEGSFFDNTRTHAPFLDVHDNELALYATALSNWKRTHKFCSACGKPLMAIQGGTCMQCTACKNLSWPRQDPSMIVLVTNREGDKALLARSPRHPPKFHAALAGFVEAGETFERAVAREVHEETGVIVDLDSISYLSSQPWPFPRSCMIGFRATADDSLPLTLEEDEIVSAGWFERIQVMAAAKVPGAVMNKDVAEAALSRDPSLDLLIPPKGVLARVLIDSWLLE